MNDGNDMNCRENCHDSPKPRLFADGPGYDDQSGNRSEGKAGDGALIITNKYACDDSEGDCRATHDQPFSARRAYERSPRLLSHSGMRSLSQLGERHAL